jgi:voltage-gated potassium channel
VIRDHYPSLYLPPILVGAILVALGVILATGADLPVLQGVLFVVALVILTFTFLNMLVGDIRHIHINPIGLRASVIGVMVLETLALFSLTYLAIAAHPGQMAGMTTPLDGLYFTMTTLMTIGFGDIAAQGQLARGTVLVQMFFSVLVLSASVRLLSSLTRSITREAGHHDEAQGH